MDKIDRKMARLNFKLHKQLSKINQKKEKKKNSFDNKFVADMNMKTLLYK